jgi:RNA polymerase sigma-70 factor (ECF subfamily)
MNRDPRDYSKRDDWQLVADFCGGDEGAFAELYRRHDRRIVRRQAQHQLWLCAPDGIEDVSQSLWFHFFNLVRERKYLPVGSFTAWLTRVAQNKSIDVRRRLCPRERRWDELPANQPAQEIDPLIDADLERCMDELTQRERAVMNLTREGYADAGIAESLGVSVSNVRVIRLRARKKLKDCLERGEHQ